MIDNGFYVYFFSWYSDHSRLGRSIIKCQRNRFQQLQKGAAKVEIEVRNHGSEWVESKVVRDQSVFGRQIEGVGQEWQESRGGHAEDSDGFGAQVESVEGWVDGNQGTNDRSNLKTKLISLLY